MASKQLCVFSFAQWKSMNNIHISTQAKGKFTLAKGSPFVQDYYTNSMVNSISIWNVSHHIFWLIKILDANQTVSHFESWHLPCELNQPIYNYRDGMNKSRSQTMNNQMGYESHLNECLTSRPSCEHFQHFDDGLHVYYTYHNKNKFTNKCNARRFSIACHKRCSEKKIQYIMQICI